MPEEITTEEEAYEALRDPFVFIEAMWGLIPQEVLPEYREDLYRARRTGDYRKMRLYMFEKFDKDKHITWQQVEILRAVNYAMLGVKSRDISARSGRGIGKSALASWLILWFLFVYPMCKIPCTAPTQNQMYDVLWAEISLWIGRMKHEAIKAKYEWSKDHIRMVESPENWFARARTATKESPEALSGIHADYIMQIIDEASAVPDEIFDNAEATLTNPDYVTISISNPTRMIGRFYESHTKLKKHYQTMQFSSEESPVVDRAKIQKIIEKWGTDSPQYLVEVLGEFPTTEAVDDKGYMPLINFPIIETTDHEGWIGDCMMGVDAGGEGDDSTELCVRDNIKAYIMASEQQSTPKTIANLVGTVVYTNPCEDIVIDNFGVGADVGMELLRMNIESSPINVGRKDDIEIEFLNLRASLFWKAREWLRKGGMVSKGIAEEMKLIKYRNQGGKIQIMSKDDMRRAGIPSPNKADAFMLSFYTDIQEKLVQVQKYNPLDNSIPMRKSHDVYE